MPTTPFHVSVDSDLAKWVDNQVDERVFHNRSHAVNQALEELRKKKAVKP